MGPRRRDELRRGLVRALLGLCASSAVACLAAEESEERLGAAVSDSCGAPDGGVSGDGGTRADGGAASAPVAVADAGSSRDSGAARDGGSDGGSDGGPDGGPDAGTCSCPADTAWDGTRETIV